jgi:hypothetical protein
MSAQAKLHLPALIRGFYAVVLRPPQTSATLPLLDVLLSASVLIKSVSAIEAKLPAAHLVRQ